MKKSLSNIRLLLPKNASMFLLEEGGGKYKNCFRIVLSKRHLKNVSLVSLRLLKKVFNEKCNLSKPSIAQKSF